MKLKKIVSILIMSFLLCSVAMATNSVKHDIARVYTGMVHPEFVGALVNQSGEILYVSKTISVPAIDNLDKSCSYAISYTEDYSKGYKEIYLIPPIYKMSCEKLEMYDK